MASIRNNVYDIEYAKKYRETEKGREILNKANRDYYARNKCRLLVKKKEYYKKNKEDILKKKKEYSKSEKGINARKKWIKNNSDKLREYEKTPKIIATRRKYRVNNQLEKDKIRANGLKLRTKLLKEIGHCENCPSKDNLELHHIEYINEREYVKLLCRKCHNIEHTKIRVSKDER